MYRKIIYTGNTEKAIEKRLEEIKNNNEEITSFEIITFEK